MTYWNRSTQSRSQNCPAPKGQTPHRGKAVCRDCRGNRRLTRPKKWKWSRRCKDRHRNSKRPLDCLWNSKFPKVVPRDRNLSSTFRSSKKTKSRRPKTHSHRQSSKRHSTAWTLICWSLSISTPTRQSPQSPRKNHKRTQLLKRWGKNMLLRRSQKPRPDFAVLAKSTLRVARRTQTDSDFSHTKCLI